MGYLTTISELSERIGAGTADFRDKLAEGVRDFACNLWENYPDQITQNKALVNSFARGYMNRICADKTLPSTPTSPFTGGQCTFTYDGQFQYGLIVSGSDLGIQTAFWQNVGGAITGIELFGDDIVVNGTSGNGGFPEIAPGKIRVVNNPNPATTSYYSPQILSVTPFNPGDIDNCGDPPPVYPSTNPTINDYQTTINIVSEDGDTLNFPLEYKPTNFNFPLNFDLGGIKVIFDLGGINFNFSLVSIDGLPIPIPDGQDAPLPAPQDDGNRSIPCRKRLPPSNINYNEDDKTETDPKEEDVGDTLEFVRVTLTSVPTNVKNQFGDGAPDVIYAGWFEFQGEGFNFPRQPIHFTNSLFISPEGSTGYAYTLYEGIQGKATVYTKKEDV